MAGYEASYVPGYGSGYEKCFDHNRVITDLNSDRPSFESSYESSYALGFHLFFLPSRLHSFTNILWLYTSIMPPAIRRAERARKLLKPYIRNHKGRQRRDMLRRRAVARASSCKSLR